MLGLVLLPVGLMLLGLPYADRMRQRSRSSLPSLSLDALVPVSVYGDPTLGWVVLVAVEVTNHSGQGVSLDCDLSLPLNRNGTAGPDAIYLVEKDGPAHWRWVDLPAPWDSPPSSLNPLLRGEWLRCPLHVDGHRSVEGLLGFYVPPGLPEGNLPSMLTNDGWSATAVLFVRDRVTKWSARLNVPGRLFVNAPKKP